MENTSLEYFLAEHYVYDAWQFIRNTEINIRYSSYCHKMLELLITKMSDDKRSFQDDIFQSTEFEFNIRNDDIPKCKLNILGVDVDCPFLIFYYIKNFFQYIRNTLDSMAQIANAALLANRSIDIDRVDFNRIITTMEPCYSKMFPKTFNLLSDIKNSSYFDYVNAFNNRTKHICNINIILSLDILGENDEFSIRAFQHKTKPYTEQNILNLTKNILEYIKCQYKLYLNVLLEEIKNDVFTENRFHRLSYCIFQSGDKTEYRDITIFINFDKPIDELPKEIRVLLVDTIGEIRYSNCDYDDILIRYGNSFIGRYKRNGTIMTDDLLCYRLYKKDSCDSNIAIADHIQKNNIIKPFFMGGCGNSSKNHDAIDNKMYSE